MIQTFFVSHADVTELATLVNSVLRVQLPVQPVVVANKTANTITVRASLPVLDIIERIIEANDKPRAEIVIDVEILEVNRNAGQAVRPGPVRLRDRAVVLAGVGARRGQRPGGHGHGRHRRSGASTAAERST